MSKKFSIKKAIDVDKLVDNISLYIQETCVKDPYIFANEETIREIAKDYIFRTDFYLLGRTGCFMGYKLFLDDTLSFGEVEIR